MLPNDEPDWSSRPANNPLRTEQDFILLREWARKKGIEFAIKRYFDGGKNVKNMRYFWNDGKKKISEKRYQELRAHKKYQLDKTLSSLLRKGDTIKIPPGD